MSDFETILLGSVWWSLEEETRQEFFGQAREIELFSRGGEKEKEGEEIILIPLARSLGATFSRSLWGRGREKKGKKEGKSWSIRPDVLSRLLQRREWGGRGGHNLRENLCGVSLTPSSHV